MWYLVIIVSVICIAVFMWVSKDRAGQKAKDAGKESKSAFRTEEELEEYGKPMKDKDSQPPADFDDA